MENVLIYTRVKSQNNRLQKKLQEKAYTYCKENDFNVIKVVNEIGHNKNLNRFCWRKTMHFINTNPGEIQYIVVNKYDQLTEDFFDTFKLIKRMRKLGVLGVISIEQSLPSTDEIFKEMYYENPKQIDENNYTE
jgi:DNA invertase Pin-like site-specific DNA recombinase